MKNYICDGCKKESLDEQDIPEYRMFVCDSFDGINVMLCVDCENKVKTIIGKRN